MTIDVEYAKNNFEEILTRLESGEYIELVREGKPASRLLLSSSLASEAFAKKVAEYLTSEIPAFAELRARSFFSLRNNVTAEEISQQQLNTELFRCTPWTYAVHDCLREFAAIRRWKLLPDDRPFRGEYLCDFMLFEEHYGCRVACESQWNHGSNHAAELDWAFDKLRGVKADLKLFIYEGPREATERMMCEYLQQSCQTSEQEAYLCLRWQFPSFEASFYQRRSLERSPVRFIPLPLQESHADSTSASE